MVDATISRVRMRDLARRGRCRPARWGLASARPRSCAPGVRFAAGERPRGVEPSSGQLTPRRRRSRGINHLDVRRLSGHERRHVGGCHENRVHACALELRDVLGGGVVQLRDRQLSRGNVVQETE